MFNGRVGRSCEIAYIKRLIGRDKWGKDLLSLNQPKIKAGENLKQNSATLFSSTTQSSYYGTKYYDLIVHGSFRDATTTSGKTIYPQPS